MMAEQEGGRQGSSHSPVAPAAPAPEPPPVQFLSMFLCEIVHTGPWRLGIRALQLKARWPRSRACLLAAWLPAGELTSRRWLGEAGGKHRSNRQEDEVCCFMAAFGLMGRGSLSQGKITRANFQYML